MSGEKQAPTPAAPGVTPVPDWESTPYWDAASNGVLLIKRCRVCERHHWYPRAHCPLCLSDETEWVESPGRGHVATFTVIRQNRSRAFRDWGVYAVGMVELDEGARIFSRIRGDVEAIRVGARVHLGFEPVGEAIAPVFDLDGDGS